MLDIIPFILIILSISSLVILIVRKFPQLSLLDVDTIPDAKEERKKDEIIMGRVKKKSTEKDSVWKKRVLPLVQKWGKLQLSFRQYVGKIKSDVLAEEKNKDFGGVAGVLGVDVVRNLLNEANNAVAQREWQEAEKIYIAIIKRDTKNKEAYKGLADVYFVQEQLDEAKETYKFLLQFDPENESIFIKLAEISEQQDSLEDAVMYYQQAVMIKDNTPDFFVKIHELLLKLNEKDSALEAISQAVELEPDNPKYLDKLIEASIMVGNRKLAEDVYQQLRMVNPENKKLEILKDKISLI
ncbi:MAG: hypothetical protein COX81_02635 [Candidatus Magasanikbacteria bacterium CG_4_10_14_0_2_um_filter_37_12]|uniref:Uncharacterized protein n=1 Tax=Candidatus Magasanikbacteria bacterium CG_4_10_14_0_2_um_filter_37_12 TaxID=1974637 RepID=A0A2M7V7U4_9BACT|nr:MAG: hypothetical protein COX81_02635 [Candidatus Magasanikbacteria bacterium CG_4_10_14_0_2_um_filter_37_12]